MMLSVFLPKNRKKDPVILEYSSTNDVNDISSPKVFYPEIVNIPKVITLSLPRKIWDVRLRVHQSHLF